MIISCDTNASLKQISKDFLEKKNIYFFFCISKNKYWFHQDSAIMYHHFIMDAKKH